MCRDGMKDVSRVFSHPLAEGRMMTTCHGKLYDKGERMPVELYRWVPHRPIINVPVIRRWSPTRRLINFGDELGPMVVAGMLRMRGLPPAAEAPGNGRLVSVGSVMHFVSPGDDVWGTGLNGKIEQPVRVQPDEVRIHAVRGPKTRDELLRRGFAVPNVMGDPAILLADVDARFRALRGLPRSRKLSVIPNLNDVARYRDHPSFVAPTQDPLSVAHQIATSEMVVGSSLHALVLADVLGVPARWVKSDVEHSFKYEDYFTGTDRETPEAATDVEHAVRLGAMEPLTRDTAELMSAFPDDLFIGTSS